MHFFVPCALRWAGIERRPVWPWCASFLWNVHKRSLPPPPGYPLHWPITGTPSSLAVAVDAQDKSPPPLHCLFAL